VIHQVRLIDQRSTRTVHYRCIVFQVRNRGRTTGYPTVLLSTTSLDGRAERDVRLVTSNRTTVRNNELFQVLVFGLSLRVAVKQPCNRERRANRLCHSALRIEVQDSWKCPPLD